MQKIDVEEFRSAVQVTSEEFGPDWLSAKVQEALQGRSPRHPVPLAWADTVDLLQKYEQTGEMCKTSRMIRLAGFAADLRTVRQLRNFELAVGSRLKSDAEFPKVDYEVFVASWWTRTGYTVEFIPRRHGWRTPEMKIISEHGELYIECKSRDTYIQPKTADDGQFWKALQFSLIELRKDKDIGGNLELFVFIPGERELSAVPQIVAEVQNRLRTGYRGSWVGRQAGYLVRELKSASIPGREFSLFLPAWQRPAMIGATFAIDNQGRPYPKDPMRLAFFAIDSYKLSAIGNSFNKARRQIPSNAQGLIYINLDVTGLDDAQSDLYLNIVADSLATKFAPQLNTRIAAIVVTTEPNVIHTKEDDRERVLLSRLAGIRRNPYCPLPDGISIPTE
jgi:hypothetical protein